MGISTKMMWKMCKFLKEKGDKKVSLAVQKDNYPLKMYRRNGMFHLQYLPLLTHRHASINLRNRNKTMS